MDAKSKQQKKYIYDMVVTALASSIIVVCSWISIPFAVPFTLQTFAVCSVLMLLGGKRGTAAIAVYILMGAIGLPVFAGFKGGPTVLLGTTGGYIVGFILMGLIYWGLNSLLAVKFKHKIVLSIVLCVVGEVVLYIFGTAWFMLMYAKNTGTIGLATALGWCVIPFLIPDIVKLAMASVISSRLSKKIKS